MGENGRASHFPLASGSPVCKQVTSRGKGMRLQQFCFRGVAEKREQELHERQDLDAECEVVGLELPVVSNPGANGLVGRQWAAEIRLRLGNGCCMRQAMAYGDRQRGSVYKTAPPFKARLLTCFATCTAKIHGCRSVARKACEIWSA